MATTNDFNNEYYTKWDEGNSSTLSNKDNWTWATALGNTYPGDFNTGYPGDPYGKTNVPWTPQEGNPYINPYDKWIKPDNWLPSYPNIPISPFDPAPVFPTLPKVDNILQNLINQLRTELAEQKEKLDKIIKKCGRLSKNNKKLEKENEELEKRNKKLNKFTRFDIIDIEEEDEN